MRARVGVVEVANDERGLGNQAQRFGHQRKTHESRRQNRPTDRKLSKDLHGNGGGDPTVGLSLRWIVSSKWRGAEAFPQATTRKTFLEIKKDIWQVYDTTSNTAFNVRNGNSTKASQTQ